VPPGGGAGQVRRRPVQNRQLAAAPVAAGLAGGRRRGLAVDGRAVLLELAAAGGTSGAEGPAADVLRRAWAPLADVVATDPLGNVWARRSGPPGPEPRPAVLLAAHLDTIGLVVTRLVPGGFLRVQAVGGVDPRSLLGREVVVAGRRPVPAVVATLPPHLTAERERRRVPAVDRLVLDTGLDDAALAEAVRPGDRVHFATPPLHLLDGWVAGAGLDNRAGVAALHEALLELAGRPLPCDLYVLANVQEEIGLRGIAPAGRRLRPRAAVVVDVGFARQSGAPPEQTLPAGGGPALGVGPALHPRVGALLEAEARRLEIPLQREVLPGRSGTDAWALQVAAGGIPVGLLSIPLRSMHTTAETVDWADVRRTGRLLAAFALAAGPGWLDGLGPRPPEVPDPAGGDGPP
jgi:putative aminopeptidase FrvX